MAMLKVDMKSVYGSEKTKRGYFLFAILSKIVNTVKISQSKIVTPHLPVGQN